MTWLPYGEHIASCMMVIIFWDPFAGGKFAQYFIQAVEQPLTQFDSDAVHRLIEEAQLFLEAAHSCAAKLAAAEPRL